jgi:hypothetical protein
MEYSGWTDIKEVHLVGLSYIGYLFWSLVGRVNSELSLVVRLFPEPQHQAHHFKRQLK